MNNGFPKEQRQKKKVAFPPVRRRKLFTVTTEESNLSLFLNLKQTLLIICCPSEKEISTSESAIWLSCKMVSLEKSSTDLRSFNDDMLENSDIRTPRKSSLFKAQSVPEVTARTDAWRGLLYLLIKISEHQAIESEVLATQSATSHKMNEQRS